MPRAKWVPPTRPFRAKHVNAAGSTLRRALVDGRVTPLGGGVYLATHAWPDEARQQLGLEALAMQMRRPGYVASHTAAAVVTGLPVLRPPKPNAAPGGHLLDFTEQIVQTRRFRQSPRVYLRDLPSEHIMTINDGLLEGLRVTHPARTTLDLARRCQLPEALMVADHVARSAVAPLSTGALRGSLASEIIDVFTTAFDVARLPRWHGTKTVQRVLDLVDPRRESPGESNSFGHFVLAGIPLPECQAAIETDRGVIYPDFWWPKYRLAGECDGRVKYDLEAGAERTVLIAESERQHLLFRAGIHVVRWRAGEMMFRSATVLSRIRRRLLELGWDGRSGGY